MTNKSSDWSEAIAGQEHLLGPGCRHDKLNFGSGDYYIFCANGCGARWSRTSHTQPEYGVDAAGRKIGATPEEANKGFYEIDPWRHRRNSIDES